MLLLLLLRRLVVAVAVQQQNRICLPQTEEIVDEARNFETAIEMGKKRQ